MPEYQYVWEAWPPQEPYQTGPAGIITHNVEDDGETVVTQISGHYMTVICQALIDNIYLDYGQQRPWNPTSDPDMANYDWENWPTE